MLTEDIVSVQVGWALPNEEALKLNFHISIHGVDWNETHDYSGMVSYLDESIRSNCETLAHIRLPTIDKDTIANIDNALTPRVVRYNVDAFKLLDKHRKAIEAWINEILSNIVNLDEESKNIIKQMFFKSSEKMQLFNLFFQTIKKNIEIMESADKKTTKSMLTKVTSKLFKPRKDKPVVVGLSERNLTNINGGSNRSANGSVNGGNNEIASVTDTSERPVTDVKPFTLGNFVRRVGGTRSLTDGKAPQEVDDDIIDSRNTSTLRIEVQRGQTINSRVLVYDIILRISSKKYPTPVVYSTFQRYNSFKALNEKLVEANRAVSNTVYKNTKVINNGNMDDYDGRETTSHADFINLIQTPFPVIRNMKTLLRMSLSDSDLSVRTRNLDAWFREVCTHYRSMPAQAKSAVREFLNFDMTRPKDIFVQDQLAWGTIEAPGAGSVLIVQRSALNTVPDGFIEQVETMSATGKVSNRPTMDSARSTMRSTGNSNIQSMIWETASHTGGGANGASHRPSMYRAKEF